MSDRTWETSKHRRARYAARKLQRTMFPARAEYEIMEDIMNGVITFKGERKVIRRRADGKR